MPAESMLGYVLASWFGVTAILIVLVIYGNALSTREDNELYLNSVEQAMMASEQRVLIREMEGLARVIIGFAVLSGSLLVAAAGLWAWIGWNSLSELLP